LHTLGGLLNIYDEDSDKVRKVYDGSVKRGLKVRFDKVDILYGNWMSKTREAIDLSRYFVICISNAVLQKNNNNYIIKDNKVTTAYNIAKHIFSKDVPFVP